jgi:drug/metabolite transporter (DMT)-like permease
VAAALALLTSLCYGLSNYAGPTLSRDAPVYAVLVTGQAVALLVSAAVILGAGQPVPDATVWGAAAVAGAGNAWGLIAFYRAASYGPLSIVTPIGSLSVLVPVGTGLAEGEGLGAAKLTGLVLALGGVFLVTRARSTPGEGAHDVRRAATWGLAAAVGFGLFLTFVAPASQGGVFWAVALSRVVLLAVYAGAAALLRERIRAPARTLPKLAVPGVLLFAGTLAYAEATRLGDLSVVSVLGTLFPIVTVALAFVLGGERLRRVQALGVVTAIAGVVLVSLRG